MVARQKGISDKDQGFQENEKTMFMLFLISNGVWIPKMSLRSMF